MTKYAPLQGENLDIIDGSSSSAAEGSTKKSPHLTATGPRSESGRPAETAGGGAIGHVGLNQSPGERRDWRSLTMTNVERVQAAYAAFLDGDMTTVFGLLADDIEWVAPEGYPHGGAYQGHEGVGEVLRKAVEVSGPGWKPVTDRFVGFGGEVLVEGRHVGVAPDGSSYEIPYVQIFTVRDGKAVRFVEYGDSALYREISHS